MHQIFFIALALWVAPLSHADLAKCADAFSIPLPIVAQTTEYTCGAACMDSVIRHWRVWSPGEIRLAQAMGTTPELGTNKQKIIEMANRFGLIAFEQIDTSFEMLKWYVARGETVYVSWASNGSPHYSLVKGVGFSHISLMDPYFAKNHPGQYNSLSLNEFLPFWNDRIRFFGHIIRIYPIGY